MIPVSVSELFHQGSIKGERHSDSMSEPESWSGGDYDRVWSTYSMGRYMGWSNSEDRSLSMRVRA